MKFVPNSVSKKVARQALKANKNSPTILFAVGVAGVTCSTVLACRATLRVSDVLDTIEKDKAIAKGIDMPEKYSEDDRSHDLTVIHVQGALKIAKLYAPAVIVGLTSVGALTWSHKILNERNIALTAAYAAVDEAFKKYRERVVEKYGEDEDRRLRFSHEDTRVLNEETGKHETRERVDEFAESQYARFFDQLSTEWSKEPEYNLAFLRAQQNYWNDILRARGHVFLNEVYKSLGLDHSSAGAVVGWVLNSDGDNFVDFGIWRDNEAAHDFVNGREGAILLDFNVDGVIFDKIDGHSSRAIAWQQQ